MNSALSSRFAAVALVFALYSATMCRWIGAGDTAIVVWNMDQLILSSHVNNHPAMVAIGSLLVGVPFGTPAWRANWFSVVFTTLYLGLFHTVIWRAIKDPVHALLATLVLAVTHAVWWHATIVENYALNGVSLLTVTWMLHREHESKDIRWMYGAGVVAGLAVFNHVQMGLLAPMLGMYALVRDGWDARVVFKRWALLFGGWVVGLGPFLLLLGRNMSRGGHPDEVVKNAVGSHFTALMFDLRLMQTGTIIWQELAVQFPSPVLLLLPFGVVLAFWKNERWQIHAALGAGFFINTSFFLLYHTWDRFAFLIPSWIILEIWLAEAWGYGLRWADANKPWFRRAILGLALVSIAMPPMVYRELPRLGRAGWFWHNRFSSNGQWNTHDIATYLANPDKSNWRDLDRLNELLLEKLPMRSVVIDDDGRNHYTLNLYYQKVMGRRKDIRANLVNAWGFEGWGQDKEKLADKILTWRKRSPVFAMTLMPPHRKWQEDLAVKAGLGPQPWYLDDDIWIYEFAERPRGNANPFIWELQTGLRLKGNYQVMTPHFGPQDDAQVRIRTRKIEEGEQSEADLRFTLGDLEVFQRIELEAGERTVAPVPDGVRGVPGRWKVEILVDGQADTFLYFTNEETAVDRRFR